MKTIGLNHFNITAPYALLERVRDFYVEALGLTLGERPPFARRGFWLYAEQLPIVHLTACDETDIRAASDSLPSFVDHIAFTCADLAGLLERLKRMGIPYEVSELPAQVQVFIRDPAGVGVELNFAKEAV